MSILNKKSKIPCLMFYSQYIVIRALLCYNINIKMSDMFINIMEVQHEILIFGPLGEHQKIPIFIPIFVFTDSYNEPGLVFCACELLLDRREK